MLAVALGAGAQPAGRPVADGAGAPRQLPTVRGVVASVEGATLVLGTGAPGRELRLLLDRGTVVMTMKPMTRIGAAGLRKGDAVTVAYEAHGGKLLARRVWVAPRGAAAGPPAGEARSAATP